MVNWILFLCFIFWVLWCCGSFFFYFSVH
jgi:hypothetical protein